MNSKKTLVLLAAALAVILGAAALLYPRLAGQGQITAPAADSSQGEAPSVPAPSFSMETPEGETVELADLLDGRPAVLNFWASTCPPCVAEMPDFQAAYEDYGEEIQFIMLNVGDAMRGETREKADAYLEEEGYTLPVYFDLDYQGITAYGVTGFPHTYFIDEAGNVCLYAPGMIAAEGLQQGLHAIAPELVPAPAESE